ncbi:MAG: bifunctional glutamate N-acetyltransferase/amino-acid acetyltransferase ArgJ [Gammaproteobacteria bacterium]|nr:bifunctional glutamate N-acetyltransferase/amino-acid acetyltransferase ArgJ [Gammaproteobacteria bacterium]
MAVNLKAPENLLPVAGVELAAYAAGIRYSGRDDVVLLRFAEGSETAAVFTQNAFCAAPVQLAKQRLLETSPRALLINSGNANCGTGDAGMQAALESTAAFAAAAGLSAEEVLPFSTGVIGELLPTEPFLTSAAPAVESLAVDKWSEAAAAIMTTDTVAKAKSIELPLSNGTITLTGMAKGSGMICPNMATMLGFVATDAAIEKPVLQAVLSKAVAHSFNAITVDGDTSTNDACTLTATGASGVVLLEEDQEKFAEAVTALLQHLAQAIIRDGEGATKFVAVNVSEASSEAEAKSVAYTVAHSPLVKTALFASDPNWGRILAAVGRAPVDALDVSKIDIALDAVAIVEAGGVAPSYTEEAGQAVFDQEELSISITLGRGDASFTMWTSDLSHEYVRINAEYRS